MPSRDPLSVRYDPFTHRLLSRAIRTGPPRVADGFIQSLPQEFRALDRGGRTAHERAFTRSVYYLVWRTPVSEGTDPAWSAKLTWGKVERRGGHWGRRVRVRLFRYSAGQRHVASGRVRSWVIDESFRSTPGARIDQAG